MKTAAGAASAEGEAGRIAAGDQVWLSDVNAWGTVLSVREEEDLIEVQVGQTRVRLNTADAGKVVPPPGKKLPEPSVVTRKVSARAPSLELDLRGWRADDAITEVDRYLNDASLANLSRVSIIHGHGTGALRRVVREMLSSHALVRSFRPGERGEGGDGVTVVNL
jgi:DNA mismatch repair protein MutS2